MSSLLKTVVVLLLCLSATAAEFSTTLTLPGERYATPTGAFFPSTDGATELIAGANNQFWRYQLEQDGSVQRYPHSVPKRGQIWRYKFGEDVVEITRYAYSFGIFPTEIWASRISASGQVRFSTPIPYGDSAAPLVQPDNDGGFWLLFGPLRHVSNSGVLTTINVGSAQQLALTANFAFGANASGIFRIPLSLAPAPIQQSMLPSGLHLFCLRALDDQHLVALSTRSLGAGQISLQRVQLEGPGIVTSVEELNITSSDSSYPACANNRAYLIRQGIEVLMFDENFQIQWRTPLQPSIRPFYNLNVGPQGQAIANSGDSLETYFSATGSVHSVPKPSRATAGFAADGRLLISQLGTFESGDRLQVQSYAAADAQPLHLYDLPAPAGAPVLMAAALEADQLELFTVRSSSTDDRQYWQVSMDGSANLSYQARTAGRRVESVDRLPGAWVSSTWNESLAEGSIEAASSVGQTLFSIPLRANALRCESQRCNFANDDVAGLIDSLGAVSGLALTHGQNDYSFLPAPPRRASILSNAQVGQIVGSSVIYGPALAYYGASQNEDGTHFLLSNNRLILSDAFGIPIWEKPCLGDGCRFLLDGNAKRSFMLIAIDDSSASLQEIDRSGNAFATWTIPLASAHSIHSEGALLWLRLNQLPNVSVLAFDSQSLSSRFWLLPEVINTSYGRQLTTADRAYLSLDYVRENATDALKITRLEFNYFLQNGFE